LKDYPNDHQYRTDAGEILGEALCALSARLKASGFLDDTANHAAYERVVAAFNAPSTQPRGDVVERAHFDPDLLEAIEAWALGFEQKINVGPVQSDQDEYVASTAAATVELVRCLAALQSPQPAPGVDVERADLFNAIHLACQDETAGKPAGCIIEKGCEFAGYCDPESAADAFKAGIVEAVIAALAQSTQAGGEADLCDDCPPNDYPTDKTRCLPCPRRAPAQPSLPSEGEG